jgi:hypothetical protein
MSWSPEQPQSLDSAKEDKIGANFGVQVIPVKLSSESMLKRQNYW